VPEVAEVSEAEVDHTEDEAPVEARMEDGVPLVVDTEEIAQVVAVDTKGVAVLEKEQIDQVTVLADHHTVLIVQDQIVRHTEVIDHNALLVDTKEAVHKVEDIPVIAHDLTDQVTVLLVQREPEVTKEVVHESNDEPKRVVIVASDQDKTTNTAQPDSNSTLPAPTKSHAKPMVIAQNVPVHLTDQLADTRKNPTPHHVRDPAMRDGRTTVTNDGHVKMGGKINYNVKKISPDPVCGMGEIFFVHNQRCLT